MQSKGAIKLLAILLAIACVYQLSFSFKARSVEKDAAAYAAKFSQAQNLTPKELEERYLDSVQNEVVYNLGFAKFTYKDVKSKEINLGLDLKGGMNVMLEIQVKEVVKTLAGSNANDPKFKEAIKLADAAMVTSPDNDYIAEFVKAYDKASNGANLAPLFISADRSDIKSNSSNGDIENILQAEAEAAIETSFNVLKNRIDRFGVVQPNIQRVTGTNRISVELPGIKEPQRVSKLLEGAASLEFWVASQNSTAVVAALQSADAIVREKLLAERAAAAEGEETDEADTYVKSISDMLILNGGGPIVGSASDGDRKIIDSYLDMAEVQAVLPSNVKLMWSINGDERGYFTLYALDVTTADGKAPLDGDVVVDADGVYSQQSGSSAEVSMTMNGRGAAEWARITEANIGNCIAIVLDGYVYSAPVIRDKIEGGRTSISGDFTIQEAKDLANVLKSGKVPAPAKIIQSEVVGPSLGQESINAGIMSFLIAFVLVLLYMGLFYKGAGWLADVALICNVFFLFGFLVSWGAVLTLPGIAGIVLTMGMAVDANVIIYERIKEELRGGKGMALAIKDGFSNAYSAIIDGNVTTLITGIILAVFGTGPVQGFATTLVIGIITSLFCSVFITRLLIEWAHEKFGKVSFSRKWSEGLLNNTKIKFVEKRKYSYIISSVIIVLSIGSLAIRGLNLGTEFTGGRSYVVRFDSEVTAESVRSAIEKEFAKEDASGASFEVKQYGDDNQMRIVTQYNFSDTSEAATTEINEKIYEAVAPLYSEAITFEDFSNQDNENGIVSTNMIGPSIASDMTRGAVWSILLSLLAISLYITLRFRRWQWATGATAALIHDAFIVIGLFSILYGWAPFNLEVNQAFIAAILTIIGYSINDTVIIFDRIREYITLYPKRELKENIDKAINSTMVRTLNTSGTTLVTLLSIFILGGETIRGFVFALLVGVVVGTYSSLFVATPIAYDLMKKKVAKAAEQSK